MTAPRHTKAVADLPDRQGLRARLLEGSNAARFAAAHSDRLAQLVLVDSLGLPHFRPRCGLP